MRRAAVALVVALLAFVALVLRLALDLDGVLDTDAINFGLAAFRFDVLDHQPHPPGYPGYVLYLKVLHLLAPWLGPIEVAKWGSRLAGAATVPAAFLACRELLALDGAAPPTLRRPLVAAGLAALSPILWYYGADGQSHAAEGLLALLLLGAVAAARRAPGTGRARLLLVAVAFGLAGSVRPTVPALLSPLLVWLLWGRPARDWIAAAAAGAAAVAAWTLPLVAATGGWGLYRRASGALFGELFVQTYSVFGERVTAARALRNASVAALSLALACLPLVVWTGAPRAGAAASRPWRRALLACVALGAVFFAAVYTAETGYFAGVAALATVAPATWPAAPRPPLLGARTAVALAASASFVLVGPAALPVAGGRGSLPAPTLAHVAEVEAGQRLYRALVCGAAAGRPALVVTDNPVTTHSRILPLACPGVLVALHVHDLPLNPALDNVLVYGPRSLESLPTPVPLELGPPGRASIGRPIERLILVPDATDDQLGEIAAQASCPPIAGVAGREGPRWPDGPVVWPARCFRQLRLGRNVLEIPPG